MRGSQNLKIDSRDSGHAHLEVVLWSVCREGPSSISAPNLKLVALFVRKLRGVPKSANWSRDPTTPIYGSFLVLMQNGSILYVCTKFEADSSLHSEVIRGPKISKLGHVTLSHAAFKS